MLQDSPPRSNQQGEPAVATINHTQADNINNQSLQYLKKYALILSPASLMTNTNSEKPPTTSTCVQIPPGSTYSAPSGNTMQEELDSAQYTLPTPGGSTQQQEQSSAQCPSYVHEPPYISKGSTGKNKTGVFTRPTGKFETSVFTSSTG